jgi:ribosomal protein L11 methylase PrmA
LGAGTGIAGIAVDKYIPTKQIVLTDGSKSALELCKRNCEDNHVSRNVAIHELRWGETLPLEVYFRDAGGADAGAEGNVGLFDTIIAADVLYDLQMWNLILKTAKSSLKVDGTLILSHVPRAAIPFEEYRSMEDIIVDQAELFGFSLSSTIFPHELLSFSMTYDSRKYMQDIGAVIFVWRKSTF